MSAEIMVPDYIETNRKSWNNRVDTHLDSEFYDVNGFLEGKSSLKEIELGLLGDVKGKTILHLQCHFGQDSISLARMGAAVNGVDFSDKAIEAARELALKTGTNAQFICSDIYELPEVLQEKYDIVFTSYGTIGWLPDLDKWAAVVSRYLKPGGCFVFAEFHPVVWMFDNEFEKVGYSYFNTDPIVEEESGTYANRDADIQISYVSWNHSLSEVLQSLMKGGLKLEEFLEYDYSPYNCFKGAEEFEPGKFRIKHLENRIPMVYALSMKKD
jgi:2-polyprenyl-3-methyl-5-hydroxy-6-metoxy-1,4-benzoquinol methylase